MGSPDFHGSALRHRPDNFLRLGAPQTQHPPAPTSAGRTPGRCLDSCMVANATTVAVARIDPSGDRAGHDGGHCRGRLVLLSCWLRAVLAQPRLQESCLLHCASGLLAVIGPTPCSQGVPVRCAHRVRKRLPVGPSHPARVGATGSRLELRRRNCSCSVSCDVHNPAVGDGDSRQALGAGAAFRLMDCGDGGNRASRDHGALHDWCGPSPYRYGVLRRMSSSHVALVQGHHAACDRCSGCQRLGFGFASHLGSRCLGMRLPGCLPRLDLAHAASHEPPDVDLLGLGGNRDRRSGIPRCPPEPAAVEQLRGLGRGTEHLRAGRRHLGRLPQVGQ